MQKWEYLTVVKVFPDSSGILNIEAILRPLGDEGWELIIFRQGVAPQGFQNTFIFKRPKTCTG